MWTISLSGRELLPLAGILSCMSEKVFPSAFLPMEGFEGENTLKEGDAPYAETRGVFNLCFQVPSYLSYNLWALLLHISFYFLSVPLPGAGLLSSSSRDKGRPDAFALLKLRGKEKTCVNQIFHNSPSGLKSGWNGIFLFRCQQQ